jgi:hypothetical protein
MIKKIKNKLVKFLKFCLEKLDDDMKMDAYLAIISTIAKNTKTREDDLVGLIFTRGVESLKKEKKIDQKKFEKAIEKINEAKKGPLKNVSIESVGKAGLNLLIDQTPFGPFINL